MRNFYTGNIGVKAALDHTTGQAMATSEPHQVNTARPAHTASRTAAPAHTARERWAMGEPFSRPFPGVSCAVQCGRRRGATGEAMARTGHTAPGEGVSNSKGKATRSAKHGARWAKKRGGLYVSELFFSHTETVPALSPPCPRFVPALQTAANPLESSVLAICPRCPRTFGN